MKTSANKFRAFSGGSCHEELGCHIPSMHAFACSGISNGWVGSDPINSYTIEMFVAEEKIIKIIDVELR